MTTSYTDNEGAIRVGNSATPTYDSEGNQVYKPSVGVVFKPAFENQHSYGGVVGALQDAILTQQGLPSSIKAYPHNFAGIISAIKDLEVAQGGGPPVAIQPIPPGSEINGEGDLIVIIPPEDGDLWFDTRQGRLFVGIDKEWWQTNGADGLAYVRDTNNPPGTDDILPGQFWYDDVGNDLYVFNGTDWVLIADGTDAGAFQTTATLPLASTGPRSNIGAYTGEIIPTPDLEDFNTQQDYNWWAFDAIVSLETELNDLAPVIVDEVKPDAPKEGQLWYDTSTLDMSVWYDDGDTAQWVPVSSPFTYDEDLDVIRRDLTDETRQREIAIQAIYERFNNLDISNNSTITQLQSSVAALNTEVDNVAATIDFTPYALKDTVDASIETVLSQLHSEIADVTAAIPDVSGFADSDAVLASFQTLTTEVDTKTTVAQVGEHINTALVNGSYVNQAHLDAELADLSRNYLTHAGGTLTGSLVINKQVANEPALDFSSNPSAGKPAFKFQTVSADSVSYSTFGTTDKFYEYAWKFDDKEDFCWVYADTNKVFSINKDGPACSQLYIGDFSSNNAQGRYLRNKIDVRDRLTTYQNAFETMRQGVTNATDFDSLKANILTALASV